MPGMLKKKYLIALLAFCFAMGFLLGAPAWP